MLSKKGEDNCIPLDFWLAADRLKKQIGKLHHEGCVTLEEIHKTYFARNADMSEYSTGYTRLIISRMYRLDLA